jgi:hypothetical protein
LPDVVTNAGGDLPIPISYAQTTLPAAARKPADTGSALGAAAEAGGDDVQLA